MLVISMLKGQQQSKNLLVFCPIPPFRHQFRQEQFRTVGDFKSWLRGCFGIEQTEQRLYQDGQRVALHPQAPFSQLKLNKDHNLLLLAKNRPKPKPKKFQKDPIIQRKVKEQLQRLQWGVKRARQAQNLRLIRVQQQKRMIYCLRRKAIDAIITTFIRTLKIPHWETLVLNEDKLKFILSKIVGKNQILHRILLKRLKIVRNAIIDPSLTKQNYEPILSTIVPIQLEHLVKLGYARQTAEKALQMSKNRIDNAIKLIESGEINEQINEEKRDKKTKKKLGDGTQYKMVFEQMSKVSPKDLILLNNWQGYIAVYLNCLKHTHPSTFQLLSRRRAFLPSIVLHLYKKIQLPR